MSGNPGIDAMKKALSGAKKNKSMAPAKKLSTGSTGKAPRGPAGPPWKKPK